MTTGYRFRANPPKPVAAVLLRWIGCQRFIKNAKVREDQYFRAFKRRFLEFAGQHAPVDQAYSHLIGFGNGCEDADTTWLRQVPGTVLRNGAVRFYQGYQRFFKGLALRPTISGRHGEQSVWLTSDCFRFEESVDADGVMGRKLIIGTKKFPCGELPFVVSKGCKNWKPPASLHISVNGGRWHISFSNDAADQAVPSEEETLEHLRSFSEADLMVKTMGLDRGVAVPLMAAGATGPAQSFKLLEVQHQRLAKKQIQRARWQRRAARRVKGSKNRAKANVRAAKAGLYAACVRQDFAHQTSRALVKSDNLLFVFEALKVKNMTKSAAGTLENPGARVAQKRGLNRAILGSSWGQTKQYTKYKALAAGKLCVEVPPHHSSQECSACGHIHADNRITQDRFVCQRCGHAENADANAGRVIAKRGVKAVLDKSFTLKEKKKVGGLRRPPADSPEAIQSVGLGESEPSGTQVPSTLVEIRVSRKGQKPLALRSVKQETPTTALRA
jgi:putative transposase